MRIETVTLENIRSHVKSKIMFNKGFNCLVGGLGTGKSSILYAIDFVLFGDPIGKSYHYLLREGENVGKVTIEFLLNGRNYRIERGLERRGKRIGQDVENLRLYEEEKLVASAKNEAVAEQLKNITGLDRELFREVIWVRQEHLKELLDATPRERQKKLDQLFGLSDYEVAWSNTRAIQREYDVEKTTYEKDFDVVGMGKLEADYHTTIEDFSKIENQMFNLEKKLQESEAMLHTASTELQNLENLRKEAEGLSRKEAELQTNIANTEDLCARLVGEIQRRETNIKEYQQRLEDSEKRLEYHRSELQQAGLATDLNLEGLKVQLSHFDEQLTSIRAEQEAARKETNASKQRKANLTAKSECPLCLQPLQEDYKAHMLKHAEEENRERDRRLGELQKNSEELGRLRETVHKAFLDFQAHMPRIQETRTRLQEEMELKEKVGKEFEEKQLLEQNIRAQLKEVRAQTGKFDISELENAQERYETASKQYHTTKANLQHYRVRKNDTAKKIEDFRERLERAQQKMERAKKIDLLLETVEGIRDAYRGIQPKLRREFIKILERMIQRVLDDFGEENRALIAHIDETYTPSVKSQDGYEREVSYLSGGERTILAFAYRFTLGQLIMHARTGHGLQLILLDEPTESLGREDRSVDRLAEAIARLKAIEQIIAVSHNEAFAEKADHVTRLHKEANTSRVDVVK